MKLKTPKIYRKREIGGGLHKKLFAFKSTCIYNERRKQHKWVNSEGVWGAKKNWKMKRLLFLEVHNILFLSETHWFIHPSRKRFAETAEKRIIKQWVHMINIIQTTKPRISLENLNKQLNFDNGGGQRKHRVVWLNPEIRGESVSTLPSSQILQNSQKLYIELRIGVSPDDKIDTTWQKNEMIKTVKKWNWSKTYRMGEK